jgi:hypothetical protein
VRERNRETERERKRERDVYFASRDGGQTREAEVAEVSKQRI